MWNFIALLAPEEETKSGAQLPVEYLIYALTTATGATDVVRGDSR